jgi:hypothetical protein
MHLAKTMVLMKGEHSFKINGKFVEKKFMLNN